MNAISQNDLTIRPFQNGDGKHIKRWLDEFLHMKTQDDYELDIEEAIRDGNHYLIIVQAENIAIAATFLKEEKGKITAIIGIGDLRYRNKKSLQIIRDFVVTKFLNTRFCDREYDIALFFENRALDEVLKETPTEGTMS